jgi:phage terminase large subunit-like protein
LSKPLSIEEKLELYELLQLQVRRKAENWLLSYEPYPKQVEFHAKGSQFRERLFMAGNQLGKTWAGAAELAYHVTGRYPADWKGRRFPRATTWMVGSESAELTKNGIQRLLLGPPAKREEWGTGTIPKDCIKSTSPKPGVADAVATIVVEHELGEQSVIQFHSYDQGRTKWQADTVDGVWFDEEPPLDIYSEGLTRTNATQGLVFVTFTPLLGMSAVVKRFLVEKVAGSAVTYMTIDDAPHYTKEQRDAIVAAYPAHEREARANGTPIMGSGLVFPIAESTIRCEQFDIPAHWGRLNALDFGWGHKAAWVALAHDRDADIVYVYDIWAESETTVAQQAMIITGRGQHRVPTAWPHDGLQHDKGSGEVLKAQYEKFGINMTAERAQFPPTSEGKPGGNSVEAGISMMLERFEARSLRVFKHLEDWFAEFRLYHRKDGRIVKEDDDLMSATRYGCMMLRRAKTLVELGPVGSNRKPVAPRLPTHETFDETVGW